MPKVPAGNVSGLYYIPVAGLPFQCTWRRLKDFSRNPPDGSYIEIDAVHIYKSGGTDGWVRVKGKDNFRKALAHLNGGVLDHKSIMADGRNEKCELMLPEDSSASPIAHRHRGSSVTFSAWDSLPPTSYGIEHMTSPTMSSYATSEESTDFCYPTGLASPCFSPATQTFPNTYHLNPPPIYENATLFEHALPVVMPNVIYNGNLVPATPLYYPPLIPAPFPNVDNSHCPIVTSSQPIPFSSYPTSHPTPTSTPQPLIFPASRRKIIITRLPNSTTADELHALILRALSKHPSTIPDPNAAIENIDLQRHSDQKPRGYAYVILDSYASAKVVIDKLNGYHWQSKKLEVRLTKEPVETGDVVAFQGPLIDRTVTGNENSHSNRSSTSRGRGREEGRSKSSGGGEKRSSDKHTSVPSETRSSRSSGDKKHRTKGGESSKRTSKSGSGSGSDGMPLVVDGSSHRHQR